mgnify:CR=1 FL=1
MGLYYIHKVGHQEMGSVTNRGDRPARGRYFLISKRCLDFFPHLSSVVMNDKIVITIVSMKENGEERVLCTMDYHNQKYADITYTGENPRDEVRLYMNNAIDPNKQYFFKGDYAIFEKFEDDGQLFYSLTRITPDNIVYSTISALMESEAFGNKTNLTIETEFDFIPKPSLTQEDGIIITREAQDVIQRESDALIETENERQTTETNEDAMGSSFFNSGLFRDLVMNAYEYKCAITGKVIKYKDLYNLEAAHIKPQAHQGTFLPCNGIAMSRDMHFAFDKGFFTIDDDYTIIVSELLKENWFYTEYNGKRIFVPTEQFYRPNLTYLKHHREHVFNTFKQIRRI